MRPTPDPDAVEQLRVSLNDLPEPLARTLVLRGITSLEGAKHFFRPDLSLTHDPFLMKDMDMASDRVLAAIERRERVLVYGDYDVDGTTASALMVSFLRDNAVDALYFIPHRIRDGYGLHPLGIDYAVNAGASLIIALDCGITAFEEADYARSRGIDLIICDHHLAEKEVPRATAVLDPKRPDCTYPFDGLSGCGVGYKLIEAVSRQLGRSSESTLPYLDLVALSIASDIVPIVGENRLLMYAGLEQIRESPRLGLRKLAEATGLDLHSCDTGRIVFGIGPRINAAGRLADARLAVDLMLTGEENHAEDLAHKLEEINRERRQLDGDILEQATSAARQQDDAHALVLHNPNWHIGVIGIVASRIVEQFYRPAIMLTTIDGKAKGSARSIKGFNIYEALRECSDLLDRFGGHEYAAGLTLEESKIPQLATALDRIAAERITDELRQPDLEIDSRLRLDEVTDRFCTILRQFAPFGPNNRRPVFVSSEVAVVGHPTVVGSGHLKFKVRQSGTDRSRDFEVIGFNMHEYLPMVRAHQSNRDDVQMVYSIEKNTWNGRTSVQLRLKDIRSGQASWG
jgi:single-stranded-DNA-specific exonuclease